MGTPVQLDVTLGLPGQPGMALDALPLLFRGVYDVKGEFEYKLPSSAGTLSVDFNTQPSAGIKVLVLFYEQAALAPPIQLTINGGDEPLEISTGGFLAYASPAPVVGITSVDIAYTGEGRVRGWLLG